MSSSLDSILANYRAASQTEREKGNYFEELIRTYFRFEASYADLYSNVWLFADWAKEVGTPQFGFSAKDTGIDLVAKTNGTEEYHAIQCKCYAPDYRVRKADIDSFFTASGQKPFTQRIIVTTTNDWSDNAENSLSSQQPPVYKIDLHDLEVSQIDWAKYQPSKPPALKPKKQLRPHQATAKTKVGLGLQSSDRGKLVMACGTGKTFASLKIAEEVAGKNKVVLFLVPSLNLLSQSLTEWTQESAIPLHSFAVCSDAEVGKKREKTDEDIVETFAHELRYPATTDAKRLAYEVTKRHDAAHMSVIFSTYHSLDVISRAQKEFGMAEIDLVVCDEAHRTTGATFEADEKESNFVRVHDNEFLRATKRLYMTATPRIYADIPAVKAFTDFQVFSKAGRNLAHWHLNYETVAPYAAATLDTGKLPLKALKPEDYRVEKMKFAKKRDPETNKSRTDKTTVFYNDRITIRDIPEEAYAYVINGKPALEWVMERQAVTTDKDSGIVNDANLWATETMGDARYPLDLFLRVITVSLETQKIVQALPALELPEEIAT